jgi:hypothetical protein
MGAFLVNINYIFLTLEGSILAFFSSWVSAIL